MANDEPTVLLRSNEFAPLYEVRPDFRIVDDNLFDHELLNAIGIERGSARHEDLLAWQRLLRIHPEESIAAVFHEDGLRSANAIARIPRDQFVASYAGRLPDSVTGPAAEDLAGQIHDRAAAVAAQCAHAFADVVGMFSPQVRGAPYSNAAPELAAELSQLPGFDDLFGSQNFLGCPHCGSIFGPAAYFTDLMRIIDRYITDPASGNKIPEGERLEDRRPDLFHTLKLDCASTNDEVTYLALVNEILAAQISPDPVTAQRFLAVVTYPFNTPFNVPLSKVRQALRQLGTSLTEIWATYPAPVHAGVAQGYQDTTLMLDQAASRESGAYDLMEVVVADGPAAGQRRRIVAYKGDDWTATIERPFDPPPPTPPGFLIFDPLAQARDTLNLTVEMLALLLAPPVDVNDPAALSAAYGVDDIRQHLPHAGEGTLTVQTASTVARLDGGRFSRADVGSQLLIDGQLRTIVEVQGQQGALVAEAWTRDASGGYEVYPGIGLDRSDIFAERTRLTLDLVGELLRQGLSDTELADGLAGQFYINDTGDAAAPMGQTLDQRDPGNTVQRITGVTLPRLDRLSRFIRLAAATGLGFEDLDWAMRLSGAQTAITAGTVSTLALLITTAARTGMSVRTAAAYLGDLKTTGRGGGPAPADPFDQIYNGPALLGGQDPYAPGSATPFDPARPPRWHYLRHDVESQTLRTRLGAALALGDDDLTALAAYCAGLIGPPPPGALTLDLSLLSRFYRITTAATLARWPVRDMLRLIQAMGSAPPGDLTVLRRLLDTASWIDGAPLTVDDVLAIAVPGDLTPDQRREIRAFVDTLAGSATSSAITAESFLSPAISAEQSAELATQLTDGGVINAAGILGTATLDHPLATELFPLLPDAFVSELIDAPASAAVVAALVEHQPPYLSYSPGTSPLGGQSAGPPGAPAGDPLPAFLTQAYTPDAPLEFLFPPDTPLRAEMTESVRGVLSQANASIAQVLAVLTAARGTQDALAQDATARFFALDPLTLGATLRLVTGGTSLAAYRQDLLTPLPADAPVPGPLVQLTASLWRARRWITALAFTAADLTALAATPAAFNVADPAAPSVADLRSMASFRTLAARFGATGGGLASYLTGTGADPAADLAAITGWPPDQIAVLLAALWPLGDVAAQPPVRSVAAVATLSGCFGLAARVSADVQSLLGLAVLQRLTANPEMRVNWRSYEMVAGAALGMLAAHVGEDGFGAAFRSYSDAVDTGYRDVLLGYIVWRLGRDDLSITGPADLYARLLIDVEMSACDITTRMAQAINSVQLYLQRCRLGLEEGVANLRGIAPRWWEWMSAYRVWEANRKVFLYPENYLDPTLRRGASPEFDALKQNLVQTRVSEASVTAAYGDYFQGLTELAALVPCAAFEDVVPGTDADSRRSTLYLLARTRTAPYTYYYLTREDGDRWTPWRKIDITINSAFVTPIVAFDKLFLFWSETDVIKSSSVAMTGGNAATQTQTISVATLRYAFRTLTGAWTSPQTLAEQVPIRVLPQPYQAFETQPQLAALFDPADLFWLQPQAVKVARGLRGRARARLYNVAAAASLTGQGTVSAGAGSATVTGQGTEFLSQLRPGYRLTVGGVQRQVVAISGPASLTVDAPFDGAVRPTGYSYAAAAGKVAGEPDPWNSRTKFTDQVATGDRLSSDAQIGVVVSVDSDTELTMAQPWAWPADAGEYKIIPSDPLQTRFRPFGGPGTIAVSNELQSVSGIGTSFLSTISIGDQIFAIGETRTVIGLVSDTQLVVDRPWPAKIPVAPYTVVPQESGAEILFVQLGPPIDVSNQFSFDVWKPLPNLGDDPYIDALNRLNSRVSDALNYCLQVKPITASGQVGGGVGFLMDADLIAREARFFIAPDDKPTQNALPPFAGALDRGNSAMIAATVTSSVGGEYWLNTSAGKLTPVSPGPGSRAELLYNIATSAGLRNIGNVTGLALFDNGDEAFLLESEEPGTWPVSERVTVIPYPLAPRSRIECRIDTSPYAPRPLGVDGAQFAVTRLTTSTITALARSLSARGIAGLLTPKSQQTPEVPFSRFYRTISSGPPAALDTGHLPPDQVSFTGPFGLYQREIFFQTPYLVAGLLTANARYQDAKTWYQYIFDPTAEPSLPEGTGTDRFWRYLPFRGITIPTLLQVLTDPAGIRAYNDDPLDPFAIAEVRTSAYAKAVVMRYVENLIAWGDALFGQDTRESVNEAAGLYQMAAEVLGPRPRRLGDLPIPAPKTFGQIREEYRSRQENIPQFLIDLEHTSLGQVAPGGQRYAATGVNDIDAYFCVPANDVLDGYWELIEDRLGKIRNCQNLQGVTRVLAPFAPPLDVRAALASAAAQGGHPAEIGVDIPVYRFATLIDQAKQLAGQVVQFGGELLAALERKDAEDLLLLQTRQQQVILDMTTAIRRNQVDQLLATQESLAEGLAQARFRQAAYGDLVKAGLIPAEVENLRASETALVFNTLALTMQAASSVAFALPNVGSPFAMTYGGVQVGNALQAASAVFQIGSVVSGFAAERAMLMASYERRSADWQMQADLAGYDVRQIEAQLAASQLAITGATQEYALHVRTIEQTAAIERFLRDKFTNTELYGWMVRQLSGVYFQLFTLAYTTARQAERAYQLEVGSSRRFITPVPWDDARRGLLAGEGLSLAIGQLQQAYLQEYVRCYEIERTVSLLTQDPRALVQLRGTGECVFDLPERLFDQDYPGHYRRTLTSVSVTIPALVGPYQSVRGTLRQLGSQIVLQPSRKTVAYLLGDSSVPPPGPEALRSNVRPAQSIAISTGVDDDGVFDANLADGRYLPFERTGAVSQWRLSLPFASNQLNFDAISDVVLTLRYTAFDGGDGFRGQVQRLLPSYQGRQFVSLAQQYAAGWYGFLNEPVISDGVQVLPFQLPRVLLPPHVEPTAARVTALYLTIRTPVPVEAGGPFVTIALAPATPPVAVPFRGGYAGTVEFPGDTGPLLRDLVTAPQALGFVLADAPAGFVTPDRSRLRPGAVGDVQLVIDFQGPVTWPPAP
jgi:hypothetical protein